MRLRFGDCQLDTESHELTRQGQRLRITPKAFQLLALLVESRPRALSKAELHDQVWPDTFVGRTSLARLIHEIRRAIGDGAAEPRLLRTVPSVGYAFSGDTAEPQVTAAIEGSRIAARVVLPDGREIEIGLLVAEVLALAPAAPAESDPQAT